MRSAKDIAREVLSPCHDGSHDWDTSPGGCFTCSVTVIETAQREALEAAASLQGYADGADDLRDENARLRESVDDDALEDKRCARLQKVIDDESSKLKAENAVPDWTGQGTDLS